MADMTPPDAMSWDEAVEVLSRSADVFEDIGNAGRAEWVRAALATIQSHRVQAEADAVDAARWRRQQAGQAAIDAALAAAANNDGGGG